MQMIKIKVIIKIIITIIINKPNLKNMEAMINMVIIIIKYTPEVLLHVKN